MMSWRTPMIKADEAYARVKENINIESQAQIAEIGDMIDKAINVVNEPCFEISKSMPSFCVDTVQKGLEEYGYRVFKLQTKNGMTLVRITWD
jgi:hypothetical protein